MSYDDKFPEFELYGAFTVLGNEKMAEFQASPLRYSAFWRTVNRAIYPGRSFALNEQQAPVTPTSSCTVVVYFCEDISAWDGLMATIQFKISSYDLTANKGKVAARYEER
ncbi:hypothetical protein C8J56DRAFT_1065326 [Mycena floridula]|nr:hypothetical protein C8J56DRAFT_1065326 [Mycena floridula]